MPTYTTMTKHFEGEEEPRKVRVVKSAFDKVWSEQGWDEVDGEINVVTPDSKLGLDDTDQADADSGGGDLNLGGDVPPAPPFGARTPSVVDSALPRSEWKPSPE